VEQLDQYFEKTRKSFQLPLEPLGTDFQKTVWDQLTEIPFGTTKSYAQLAEELGGKNHVRAVGRANGKNPTPILIPCHRVKGKNGQLISYSGGLKKNNHSSNTKVQAFKKHSYRNKYFSR